MVEALQEGQLVSFDLEMEPICGIGGQIEARQDVEGDQDDQPLGHGRLLLRAVPL